MLTQTINVKSLPIEIEEDALYCIEQSNPNSYTHGYFKYPCKFIPEIPRWAMNKYVEGIDAPIIYDPFSGSGTTLLEASIRGFRSFGSEIDETAKLITRAKTSHMSNLQIQTLDDCFEHIMHCMNNDNAPSSIAEMKNIEHWFPKDTIVQLGRIKYAIMQIQDAMLKDFFNVCFASIIKKVSFSDDISPKPYVSKKVRKEPHSVEKEYTNVYKRYKQAIVEFSSLPFTVNPEILSGGAFGLREENTFDLAITSPPYINAFDYARSMRLENLWLSLASESEIRTSKQNYVGTENFKSNKEFGEKDFLKDSSLLASYLKKIIKVDMKRAEVVNKFFIDMKTNLELVYRALKPGAKYVIVIGNSSIRKIEIESWKVLKDIGESIGYRFENHFGYVIRNPYIRIPREGQGGKINIDHILVLSK